MREIKFRAWDKMEKKMSQELDAYNGFDECVSDDYILLQFTGFKDKNRRDIYEGDILKSELSIFTANNANNEYINAEVVFKDSAFLAIYNDYLLRIGFEDCEIIGNIYENPELLK